jgi:hypothetical protein
MALHMQLWGSSLTLPEAYSSSQHNGYLPMAALQLQGMQEALAALALTALTSSCKS